MKAIIISTLAGLLFALPSFAETVPSKEVPIGINSVYVPGGLGCLRGR